MPASSPNFDDDLWLTRLIALEREVRDRQVAGQRGAGAPDLEASSRVVRDDSVDGDSIFAIDVDAEEVLLAHAARWEGEDAGRGVSFTLVAEGLEPASGRRFGAAEHPSTARVIVDPIDGTRGLMFDKRSAWSLAAAAPDRAQTTGLGDLRVAVMTELPTSRQDRCDVLYAVRGRPAEAVRHDLNTGRDTPFALRPSRATDLRHGFATVCNFFQGGKELTAAIDEELIAEALGGWVAGKAEVYTDQYISTGGQFAELALGRDRMVLDLRPLVHVALGHHGTLCARPYDVCTALVAEAAGCVITAPDGAPLEAPLDTTTNVVFAAFANRALAERIGPALARILARRGLT